ncbi:MAG TPA: calcium-binding protein [Solirubrobacteraceae bacterium]|jgi:Ca2+-binding RTX toxin-like protein
MTTFRAVVLAFLALASFLPAAASAAPACTISGTTGPDTLKGTGGDDVICGLGGDDTLSGGGGDDTLVGGNGNDAIAGGTGTDTVAFPTATGPVTVSLPDGTASGQGADALSGVENATGGTYGDTLTGGNAANVLSGGGGRDTLNGGYGGDTLAGGYGEDALNGSYGNDKLDGGGDRDTLNPSFGDDAVAGGAGVDRAIFPAATGPVGVDLGAGTASGQGTDTLTGVEDAVGSRHGDTLTGSSSPNALDGGAGDDTIAGASGNDALTGGDGKDTLKGSYGNDGLAGGGGDDQLSGGVGDDDLDGGPGADHLDGGPGANTCTGGGGADVLAKTCDGTAPVVADFAFAPDTVDTSQAARTITFTVRVTDDLAGAAAVSVELRDPNGVGTAAGELTRQSGTALDGVYTGTVTLPRYSLQGAWRVSYVYVADAAGNTDFVSRERLDTAGYPTVVDQTGAGDSTAPTVAGLTLNPASVDTSSAPRDVTFDAHVTDDMAGVAGVEVTLKMPGAVPTLTATLTRQSGTALDGRFSGKVTLPRYARQGRWKVDSVFAADEAGNHRSLGNDDLVTAGFATGVDQTGADDAQVPVLQQFSFSPAQVDVSTSSQVVTFTAEVTDNLAGVPDSAIGVKLRAPNDTQIDATLTRQSGTALNGIYTGELTIPKFAVQGDWSVDYVYVTDEAFNYDFLTTADLTGAGFPTTVHVGP